MGFKLPSFLKVNFPKLKGFSIHLLSDKKSQSVVKNDNRKFIQINIGKLNQEGVGVLRETLREFVSIEGIPLLEQKASTTIDDFRGVEQKPESQKLLEFFRDKLPPADLNALRASIYLKEVAGRGENISHLKRDIIQRYGHRGNNISNLYSSGYFDSQIKPLYEEMFVQPNFSSDNFNNAYEIIVTESPYAVFINSSMSSEEAKECVLQRMEVSRKYGIKQLNIHGLGHDNVTKIQLLLVELERDHHVRSYQIMSGGSNYINAKVTMKVRGSKELS